MEVLEIKPVKNKDVSVYIIKRPNSDSDLDIIGRFTKIMRENKIDFVSVDMENDELKAWNKSPMMKIVDESQIPFYPVNIPEYAMGYLYEEIMEKKEQVDELEEEYNNIQDKESLKALNLNSWIDVINKEIQEKKDFISFELRPQWVVKKVIDLIRSHNGQHVNVVHFAHETVYEKTRGIFKDLSFEVFGNSDVENSMLFSVNTEVEEIAKWKC